MSAFKVPFSLLHPHPHVSTLNIYHIFLIKNAGVSLLYLPVTCVCPKSYKKKKKNVLNF